MDIVVTSENVRGCYNSTILRYYVICIYILHSHSESWPRLTALTQITEDCHFEINSSRS